MSKKTVGYVELEWRCPNCGGRNPGSETICVHCGAPQPADVTFEQPASEKIVQDAKVVERAKSGPDIHCAFCGTRNPATAETCRQCGAPLEAGKARESGQVMGAHRDEAAAPITCAYCGTENPAEALKCKNCGALLQQPQPVKPQAQPRPAVRPAPARSGGGMLWIVGIVALLALCIAGFFFFFNRTDAINGRVSDVSWERQVIILGLAPASYQAWRDEIPLAGEIQSCNEEIRYRASEPAPNSVEVCGTPYTIDTGTGFGEVVQECEYLVYDDRCTYAVMELQPVNTAVLNGSNLNPRWPAPELAADEQLGERSERYTIVFSADGERYTYTTRDPNEFAAFEPGSRWTLHVNALNDVMNVEPAR